MLRNIEARRKYDRAIDFITILKQVKKSSLITEYGLTTKARILTKFQRTNTIECDRVSESSEELLDFYDFDDD